MNPKVVAIKRTLIMICVAIVAPLLISFLLMLDSEGIGWTILGSVSVYAIMITYMVNLNQARYELQSRNTIDK